jgi:hypothetical protein
MSALRKAVTLDIGYEDCRPATLATMRRSAFNALCGREITTRPGSTSKPEVLTASHANVVIDHFFNKMLGRTQAMVAGIVEEAPSYKIPTVEPSADDRAIPDSARELVRILQALKQPVVTTIDHIQRDIALVRFDKVWQTIRETVGNSGPGYVAFTNVADGIKVPSNCISRIKGWACGEVGMDSSQFSCNVSYSSFNAAVVRVFGRGGLVMTSGVNYFKFPYASATEEILSVIRKGDSEGLIRRLCDDFDRKIVDALWNGRPFQWDTQTLKRIPEGLTLAEALALLTPDGGLGTREAT